MIVYENSVANETIILETVFSSALLNFEVVRK